MSRLQHLLAAAAVAAGSFVHGAPAAASTAAAVAATVHMKNFAYVPASVTVHAGDTVAFVNDDDEAHTVTAVDKSFASGGLDTGDTWKHVFAKPGSYKYFCELHPFMKGTVVVK